MKKITKNIQNENELLKTLKELSKDGGAWVYSVHSFSHITDFIRFSSPSNVPDSYHDGSRNQIGYKGQIVPFTKAAIKREANRGLGCE